MLKPEGGLRLRGIGKKSHPGRPLVSIITVVYNRGKHLDQAIRSFLGPSHELLEYIEGFYSGIL